MPLEAPVTTATFPASFCDMIFADCWIVAVLRGSNPGQTAFGDGQSVSMRSDYTKSALAFAAHIFNLLAW